MFTVSYTLNNTYCRTNVCEKAMDLFLYAIMRNGGKIEEVIEYA